MSWWDDLSNTIKTSGPTAPAARPAGVPSGAVPIYSPSFSGNQNNENYNQGEQTGWGIEQGGTTTQFDMAGNPTRSFPTTNMSNVALRNMAMVVGGGLAANALGVGAGAGSAVNNPSAWSAGGSLGGAGGAVAPTAAAAAPYALPGAAAPAVAGTGMTAPAGALGVGGSSGLGAGVGGAGAGLGATLSSLVGGGGAGGWMMPAAIAGSSLLGAYSANKAAQTQADAQREANQLLYQQYQQQRADLQPFVSAGTGAQNQLLTLLGLPGGTQGAGYGKYAKDFSMADYQADPGYAFRLSEGLKALGHSAGARGGLISGQTMTGLQDYAQNSASNEFNNAYNRYQTNRSNQLNPLFDLTKTGQASAANQAASAGNYGTQGAAGINNIGAANAAGTMGVSNALAGGVGQYLGYTTNQDLLNAIRQSQYTSPVRG